MDTLDILRDLVNHLKCKPSWEFSLVEEPGQEITIEVQDPGSINRHSRTVVVPTLRLVIKVLGEDSSTPGRRNLVQIGHYFPVPIATYNRQAWRRWVFECCRGVENHELGEWFREGDERPFQPLHGPGEMPYVVHEFRPEVDGRITQDGSVRQPYKE